MIDEKKMLKEINGMWKGYDFVPVDAFIALIERQPQIAMSNFDSKTCEVEKMRKIAVICDDNVEVMSITTRSKGENGNANWVIGIFDVQETDEVKMPEIKEENKLEK